MIPELPKVRLDPELIFLFVLPPLLFPAALFTPWRDFRMNLRPISLLAIGLVLFTTVAVAWLAHVLIDFTARRRIRPGGHRFSVRRHRCHGSCRPTQGASPHYCDSGGESLVNDATALVAYRFAVMAVVSGSFSLVHASERFLIAGLGGLGIGLVVGWLAEQFHKRVYDAPIEITVSLLTPFAAYLSAERLGVSGVLAVVTAGLYLGRRLPDITNFETRLQSRPVWEMVEFLLNGFVFILIGLQLPEVLRALSGNSVPIHRLVWFALLVSLAVILIRILWVFPATYLPRLIFKKLRRRDPYPKWQHVALVAWTGMRGVVSLAAALALPLTIQDGSPFPGRELILFLTFMVILATLVVQGLSLSLVIRWLGIKDDGVMEREEREARLKANQAALARLNEIAERESAKSDVLQRLRVEYEDHIRQVEGAEPESAGTPLRLFSSEYERLSYEALQIESRTIIKLRDEDVINDEVLRRIQRDIDLAEARLRHHQQ
jgi:CPA1 family monovalent cation:H+ antiporter